MKKKVTAAVAVSMAKLILHRLKSDQKLIATTLVNAKSLETSHGLMIMRETLRRKVAKQQKVVEDMEKK